MKKELDYKPFPECSDNCPMVELLGVCECESVCPNKFDKDGNSLAENGVVIKPKEEK